MLHENIPYPGMSKLRFQDSQTALYGNPRNIVITDLVINLY